jgi:hypothetical protein
MLTRHETAPHPVFHPRGRESLVFGRRKGFLTLIRQIFPVHERRMN